MASPRVLAKMTYAGTNTATGFEKAGEDLEHLANLDVSGERVRRACHRVGEDRIDHHQQLQEAFLSKPLPEQSRGKPADVEAPDIACVMGDGGRYQRLDRIPGAKKQRSARKGEHWKESRIGLLASMTGDQFDHDPQPELPPELRYQAMAETLSEMGKTGAKLAPSFQEDEQPCEPDDNSNNASADCADGLVGPTLKARSVVASRRDWEAFGPLLASQAWYRGFAASSRKVFVSDGSAAIEKMQRIHFSDYTSVLDILHALSYCLAAARAVSNDEPAAQQQYDQWAAMIWQGRVADVIDILLAYQTKLGDPPASAGKDDPREVVRTSRVYFENHASRMNYPKYRRQGFPLTSSLMESTVKQINRRVKSTEKYWSSEGAEAMLRLRGEYLSDHRPMAHYWSQRHRHQNGTRAYRKRKKAVTN